MRRDAPRIALFAAFKLLRAAILVGSLVAASLRGTRTPTDRPQARTHDFATPIELFRLFAASRWVSVRLFPLRWPGMALPVPEGRDVKGLP